MKKIIMILWIIIGMGYSFWFANCDVIVYKNDIYTNVYDCNWKDCKTKTLQNVKKQYKLDNAVLIWSNACKAKENEDLALSGKEYNWCYWFAVKKKLIKLN